MKILLASGASYEPPRGGSTRSNRAWLEYLASRGHECRVLCTSDQEGDVDVRGIAVQRFRDAARLKESLVASIRGFAPDRVLISTEDVAQRLLMTAEQEAPGLVVYLAHTPQMFPFGPASLNPNEAGTQAVREAAQVIAIGAYTADYIEAHTGRRAAVVHPPMYTNARRTNGGAIGLINPCAVKGISLFVELARRLPHLRFIALPGWGTTSADLDALRRVPNIEMMAPVPDIQQFFERVRVLLVPSLWPEGFGLVATEAMLRGIPVLASDLGGLPEAKLGVPYVLPVHPIERYEARFDELRMPVPVIPAQPLAAWEEALRELTTDTRRYAEVSERSLTAARKFAAGVDPADIERALTGRMRILLVQNSPYFPSFGGGNKSNRLLMEALASKGHRCLVITRLDAPDKKHQWFGEIAARGISPERFGDTASFTLGGVEVHMETEISRVRERWTEEVRGFRPDWTLVSSDDPAQLFLDTALETSAGRVVYLARTTLALPFGPDCALASGGKTEALRRTAAVVGVSQYVADYVKRYGGMDAVHLPISLQGKGPFPCFENFAEGFVTMVNPCAIKGLPIFLELARRCPEYAFAAVPTWGTTEADLDALRSLPNVTLLPTSDNIDDILSRTRVLAVPSLWAEARSRIVVEALLRGVPVLASNTGGIPEAMMGLDYVLPVRAIEHYKPELDPQMVPVADVPEQDVTPWSNALRELLGDRVRYEALAAESRRRAIEYVESIGIAPFERFLSELQPKHTTAVQQTEKHRTPAVENLSPEKRALLASRLRQRRLSQVATPAVVVSERTPLSFAQERLLRLHARDPDHTLMNVPVVRRLATPHRARIAEIINGIIARHEALRTTFNDHEQRVHPDVHVTVEDAPAAVAKPFDLARPPLFRASIAGTVLTIVVHHSIADGWSSAIFTRELDGDAQPVRMQYREWVRWQRNQVAAGAWDAQRDYWRKELHGVDIYEPAPPFSGGRLHRMLDVIPRVPNASDYAVLAAAWMIVLHAWSGDERVTVASPVANRRLQEVEATIGMFANTVLVRCDLAGNPSFIEFVERVRAKAFAALANQDYPFELLNAGSPRYLFVLQNAGSGPDDVAPIADIDTGKSEHELRLSITGRRARLNYRTDVVDAALATRLLDAFTRVCSEVSTRPERHLRDLTTICDRLQ